MNINIKTRKLRIILLLILSIILLTPQAFATIETVDVAEIKVESKELRTTKNLLAQKRLFASTNFDLRNYIEIPVKNQKSTQDCWAFATTTSLETNLQLRNNQKYDFSERHMTYATSREFKDGINKLGHNRQATSGGNSSIAIAYYTSGRGPILENDMPFNEKEELISLSEIQNKNVQKKVTDTVIFPSIAKIKDENGNITYQDASGKTTYDISEVNNIRNEIKEHIMNYGTVTTMTVSGSAYNQYYNYNLDYPAFYCETAGLIPNHQVAIIGWDDNYPVENFNEQHRPSSPGAYLILNSYGTDTYKCGCYYISYEDYFVEYATIGIINAKDIDYNNIYQYDALGMSTNLTSQNVKTLYGANVFNKNKTTEELLTEISIESPTMQQIEVYVNKEDGELSEEKLQKVEIENNTVKSGYTTIRFKEPIKLTGSKFAVAVKFTGITKDAYVAIEAPNDGYWKTATSNEGESYTSSNGTQWTDLKNFNDKKINNSNVCIKAFTKITKYNIISDSYKIEEELIYRVSPQTSMSTFKNKLETLMTIQILKNDIEMKDSDIITTGTTIKTNENNLYKIVVTGDITQTGNVTATDLSKLKLYLVDSGELNELEKIAGDVDNNGEITLSDLSTMKLALVDKINL